MSRKLQIIPRTITLIILILTQFFQSNPAFASQNAGDGVTKRYAILIHGWGDDEFWWTPTLKVYNTLIDNGYTEDRIYFFYRNGVNDPQVPTTESDKVDGAATLTTIHDAFAELARIADADDEVLVWMLGHGAGYNSANIQDPSQYGYLSGLTSVDPGNEQDYLENEFKLQALTTSGLYGGNHGMEEWKVNYTSDNEDLARVYRHQYVSRFTKTYFPVNNGIKSDQDAYIEELIDYLKIDTDRDGLIDPHQLPDTDGDGIPYYNPETGAYDDDEWGKMDEYKDNIMLITYAPGLLVDYKIHDLDNDGHVDIDLHYRPGDPLESDGEDTDDAGFFDGLDINEDGDMSDWVSINEDFPLPTSRLTDDILDGYLDLLNVRSVTIIIAACYSGGFIWDLSAPGRIIIANAGEELYGYGTNFSDTLATAFSGDAADVDGVPGVSMLEAFNYATLNDPVWCGTYNDLDGDENDPPDCEEPLYDDNGDGEGSTYSQLNSGGIPGENPDGTLGSIVYLK